jgi:hypothetical protein
VASIFVIEGFNPMDYHKHEKEIKPNNKEEQKIGNWIVKAEEDCSTEIKHP